MSKKIIFLEDAPEKLKEVISEMKARDEVADTEVLYYNPEVSEESEDVGKLKEMLGTEIKVVNLFNFDRVLDELYKDPDNLFVFDTVLGPENIEVFAYRVNVSYALRKKQQSVSENQRIWFYTVAGLEYLNSIRELFDDYVLQAEMKKSDLELKFDENEYFHKALKSSVLMG